MRKELDPRIAIAVVAILVVIIGVFAWRRVFTNPASGGPISPQEAGLGKPVYPNIPSPPASGAGTGR